ncbi:MAG TPA: hypothetical protein VFG43_15455 [Geminicoccaceae bacterium]|nr:hypothetical protein [Geminicoccaceae bacterium]
MHGLDPFEDDDGGTVFRDVITLALAGFVAVVILLLPHVQPKGAQSAENVTPPGNVIVEVSWPPDLDTDVDLWVQAPGDVPVGYSNKGGAVFNLLRDDLGHQLDVSGMNYEVSYSRGIVAGEYVVNLHLYRNRSRAEIIPTRVVVSVKADVAAPTRQILVTDTQLEREGQELTVFRFALADTGQLVPGSVHSLQTSLRSGAKS